MARRLTGLLAAAAIVGLTVVSVSAQTSGVRTAVFTPVLQTQQARLTLGSIQGTVSDEQGGPLAGAFVSALGVTPAMTTTDAHGRFVIQPLAAGAYVLRVHLAGFVTSRREGVRVGPTTVEVAKIQMHRLAPADADGTLAARPILTAGAALPSGENPTAADADNHSETAWRLRHIKRSVLKQDGDVVSIADAASGQSVPPGNASIFGRAFDNAANMAASFFTATPFSGEVNFLTTSALGAGPLLFSDFVPRGVAYMSIGAPAASGRWDVRASMSQSDVSAWVLAGSFTSRIADSHDSGFGVSYSTQQYQNAKARPVSLASVADETRTVGEIYGSDHWTVSPTLALDYGARYAHYDYLRHRSLLSPQAGVTLTPFTNTRVIANVAQRMLAPGAEEFLPAATVGPWLPPERIFTPLEGESFRVERARFYDVGVEHEFDGTYVVGVRRFQQRVDNQMATLFGLPVAGGPKSPGHYAVANAGALDAEGWAVRVSTAPVPQTATRVFLIYKVNNAFARGDDPSHPATDYRFDVQVNQALPFMPFSGAARWEVLVGLRNLFRDPNDSGSIYDELLVVRPPKRVIGGVLIRF